MDCSLSWHVNTLAFLLTQFSNAESLVCHVLIHWTFTVLKDKMSHRVLGLFFFFFFIVMWDLSWLCQKSVDAISVASALNQGGGKIQNKNIRHRI